MHFLSLVTLEIPEIIEDENTNKEIEEQIEKKRRKCKTIFCVNLC